jgi:hypothetical protein
MAPPALRPEGLLGEARVAGSLDERERVPHAHRCVIRFENPEE